MALPVLREGIRPGIADRLEKCGLCGTEFDARGAGCRPSCPMAKGCAVVCCPHCGFEFPQETGLAALLRRLLTPRSQD
jgi:hypothetical protein